MSLVSLDTLRSFETRWRILAALFLRDALEEGTIDFVVQLVEPGVMLMATVFLTWIINRQPPYGDNMLLWSATGVAPIFVFVRIAQHTGRIRHPHFPFCSDFDQCLAHAMVEFTFISVSMFMLFTGLYFFLTREAAPADPMILVAAWIGMAALGFGIGLISRILQRLFHLWRRIFPALLRGVIHVSGVYFLIDNLPPEVRYYMSFVPFVHEVTLFRMGFYGPAFPHYALSIQYLLIWLFVVLTVGISVEILLGDRIKSL